MSFSEVVAVCAGQAFLSEITDINATSKQNAIISGVTSDNRKITSGDLFVAIKGERVDGNVFAADAIAAGAVAVLTNNVEVALASGVDKIHLIAVADPIMALGKLARASLAALRAEKDSQLRVIGVTGSVGKTTTKDLLAQLLASRGDIIAPPNSFNNELGLALTVLRADENTKTLVLEMGADEAGNLAYLTEIAPPDISVVLCVARAHLGKFGSVEAITTEKAQILVGTRKNGHAILNADDPRVLSMTKLAHTAISYFSLNSKQEVYATNISDVQGNATFILHALNRQAEIRLQLFGTHHIYNALAAVSVAVALEIDFTTIVEALNSAGAVSAHRMSVHKLNRATIIDDSYNANPDSMRAAVKALSLIAGNRRKIAVLGAMLELGDASEIEHETLGNILVSQNVEVVFAVGKGLETLVKTCRNGKISVFECVDIEQAKRELLPELQEDNVILLKGSNGSKIWKIADELIGDRG